MIKNDLNYRPAGNCRYTSKLIPNPLHTPSRAAVEVLLQIKQMNLYQRADFMRKNIAFFTYLATLDPRVKTLVENIVPQYLTLFKHKKHIIISLRYNVSRVLDLKRLSTMFQRQFCASLAQNLTLFNNYQIAMLFSSSKNSSSTSSTNWTKSSSYGRSDQP